MKTQLPESINTLEEAKNFLQLLHANGESFHPEDSAHDIVWDIPEPPNKHECDQLNALMDQVYYFFNEETFDPCGYLLDLCRKDDCKKYQPDSTGECISCAGNCPWI